MFNFIAAIFLIVNGVPSDEPAAVMAYPETFPTEAACNAFPSTDAGKAAREAIDVGDKPLVVKFACVKAEDNTI